MDIATRKLLAVVAIAAPVLHTFTDVLEWAQGGFSAVQLWLNYLAFLPMPALMLGLYAVQRSRIGAAGLAGAVLYGAAFIYFAHTTLVALDSGVRTYELLWTALGPLYPAHGAAMIAGGALFGWATLRAEVFPRWTAWLFLSGIAVNLLVSLLPLSETAHTAGTLLRNAGLAAMGWAVADRSASGVSHQ